VNDPLAQELPDRGPIPVGAYTMRPEVRPELGPDVVALIPNEGTDTFGRDDFFMHGDDRQHPGQRMASKGCIVVGPTIRTEVATSIAAGDDQLQVLAYPA
jgi:hypothetical protein